MPAFFFDASGLVKARPRNRDGVDSDHCDPAAGNSIYLARFRRVSHRAIARRQRGGSIAGPDAAAILANSDRTGRGLELMRARNRV